MKSPYGDAYHHLSALAYQQHPYRWPVIGLDFADIAAAKLPEVAAFFAQYYRPDNAILSLCGNFSTPSAKELIATYFGAILRPDLPLKTDPFPIEPPLQAPRLKKVLAEVPTPVIYLAYHVPQRLHPDFYALDVLAFLLGGGRSSRLYRQLVRDTEMLHQVEASLSDSFDPGLFLVEAHLSEDQDPGTVLAALLDCIEDVRQTPIDTKELTKVINKLELRNHYGGLSLTNLGGELCVYAALGELSLVNTEADRYRAVSTEDLSRVAQRYLSPQQRIELQYLPTKPEER
ncbi:MAG: insulinase family protein [Lewinella sp.]|nr:insulinase family protein [Lewinella sp.]